MTEKLPEETRSTKLYVRIDHDDAELSTLTAISSVIKASGLGPDAQLRVLGYLTTRVYSQLQQRDPVNVVPVAAVFQGNGAAVAS